MQFCAKGQRRRHFLVAVFTPILMGRIVALRVEVPYLTPMQNLNPALVGQALTMQSLEPFLRGRTLRTA